MRPVPTERTPPHLPMRHALRLGLLAPLAAGALLTVGPTAAQTRAAPPPPGLAATETWTVTAVHRVPTRAPDATFDALAGTGWTVRARGTTALGPWQCAQARHRFVMLPAAGLFQGLGADGALSATLGLDTVPMPVPTQRIDCNNASIDVHRLAPDRAVMALDGHRIVLKAGLPPEGQSPEAVVQALLLAHLGDRVHWLREGLADYAPWLSPALQALMRQWFERPQNGQEAPALNGDPFTDTQEPPEAFVIRSVVTEAPARRAQVRVVLSLEQSEPHAVTFHLVKAASRWRIDDVALRDGTRVRALLREDLRAPSRTEPKR